MSSKIAGLGAKYNSLEEYGRGNNLKISDIPVFAEQVNLEDKVIEIFNAIGVYVSNDETEVCHYIGKHKKIVCLVNHKNSKSASPNTEKLKNIDTSSFH